MPFQYRPFYLKTMQKTKGTKTLYDKLWDSHLVKDFDNGSSLLYIDRHLIHEVTSPQAFEGLKLKNRPIWRKSSILAVADHSTPTDSLAVIQDKTARKQVEALNKNCKENNITLYSMGNEKQGIVHVVGPELGFTLPGSTVVCGDSHTSTHGAFGALAFGIGTSEVEHVMATNCLITKKSKNFKITVNGKLSKGVYSKDVALYIIGQIGTAGGTGYAIEFAGTTISQMSIEARMSLCNMAIEAGARSGMIAVDNKTKNYFKSRQFLPKEVYDQALQDWSNLHSDKDAFFDKEVTIDASKITPQVTWGTSPEMVIGINQKIPTPTQSKVGNEIYEYIGLEGGEKIQNIPIDKVFIGSCTNSRIEDLIEAAHIIKQFDGQKIAKNIKLALIVPGSAQVKLKAEKMGLHHIFENAGFEWRFAGCSMCLGMNNDLLNPFERCASTSNRNFEGRQGAKSRTHLLSPASAALAAMLGHIADVREYTDEIGCTD